MRLLVVTGTGTGIGKTVTTAALAACGLAAGQQVAVVKPVQTGVADDQPGDLAEVARLAGVSDLHEYLRYPEPLAPATAARRVGHSVPPLAELAAAIDQLLDRDLVIVEGAGGALVRFNEAGEGIGELAGLLTARADATVELVLVCAAGLGTLHDAAATSQALAGLGVPPSALVIGDWPAEPDLASSCNLDDLPSYAGVPLAGVLPFGAGELTGAEFAELAARSLAPSLGGRLDVADFTARHRAVGRTEPANQQTDDR